VDLTTHQWQRLTYASVDGALINGNLFDVLVAPSYFTIQPVRSETAMSAYPQKRKFVGMITMSALCQKQTSPSPDGAFAEAVIRSVELIVQRDAHDVVGGVSVGVNRGQVIEARPRKCRVAVVAQRHAPT
jgi:hypothetical protein